MTELCTFVGGVYYNIELPWDQEVIFLFRKMCAGPTLASKLHLHALLIACLEKMDMSLLSTFSLSGGSKLGFVSKECLRAVFRGKGFPA